MLTFLFLSTTDWDAPQFGSRQQIARQLVARGHQILFVDVPRALHSFISDPAGTRRALQRMGRIRQVTREGPLVYTPPPLLPVYYHPLVNPVNQRLLQHYLRRVLDRLGWRIDVLWTYWPHTAHLIGRLGERLAVYHCIDDFAAAGYPLVASSSIERMEAAQCRRVGLIFARTEGLAAAKQRFNPNTYILPGGVDTDCFDPARVAAPPPEIANLSRPRIGFVGTLDDRLDVALLAHCAHNLPEATFILVGPVKRHRVQLGLLHNRRNIVFCPACPYSEVPSIVAAFDICLIPYRLNPYTAGLSPIKLYEYLAMGKPVVATDLPYLRREAGHIRLSGTPDTFLAALRTVLAHPPTTEEQIHWRSIAQLNAWKPQVDEIERHLMASLGLQR